MRTTKIKKIFLFGFVGTLILLVVLTVFAHQRYPFYNTPGGGWSIGYKFVSDPLEKLDIKDAHILNFQWLDKQTRGNTKFLADPFVLYEKGTYYIFFEHQAQGNANIGLLQSVNGLDYEYKGEVLDEDFHLSFPQVFKHKEEYYMLPESKAAGNILLYKAANFPYDWEIYDTLVKNVKVKDPALLLSDTLNIISAVDDDLRQIIYESNSLEGPWINDSSFERRGDRIRAGGNFFEINNRWFVPLQKNNEGYGSGLALFEFRVENNEKKFIKVIDRYLEKSDTIFWFNKGMHHMSVIEIGNKFYSVFDGDIKDTVANPYSSWKASLKYNYYDFLNLFQ